MNLGKQAAWLLVRGEKLYPRLINNSELQTFLLHYTFGAFMFRIAVYKALYRLFGGFVADVVAAIDQVCKYIIYSRNLIVFVIAILPQNF